MRRVNLLHAHGSPTGYLYNNHGCRCVACRGWRAAYHAAYHLTHREEIRARDAAYRIAHRGERAADSRRYSAAHREEIAAYNAAYRVTHREEAAAYRLERTYGLLPGERDAMFAAQDNSCAICGDDEPGNRQGWNTDHDHGTGVVRGILCHGCNVGLGGFRDDPERLTAAIEYLGATP